MTQNPDNPETPDTVSGTFLYDCLLDQKNILVSYPLIMQIYLYLSCNGTSKDFSCNINSDYITFLWFNFDDLSYLSHNPEYAIEHLIIPSSSDFSKSHSYKLKKSRDYFYLGRSIFSSAFHIITSPKIPEMHFSILCISKTEHYASMSEYPGVSFEFLMSKYFSKYEITDFVSIHDFYLPTLMSSLLKFVSYDSIKSSLDSAVVSEIHEI